jgi:ABC-2 type transport system ATP-binding protein
MGLVVEHIDKSFGQLQVIKDLSMEVREGSIFGFLGPNGAGKTTTMRQLFKIARMK